MAVRRERVVLELEDRFSGPLGRPIAAAQVLDTSLNDLDKSTVRSERSLAQGGREVDRMSGRLRLLADAALLVGPALVPIGAIGIPALTGLASAGGAAALGVGTMVAAFQGVGDALDAVNTAQLDPTTENLEAARLAMERLGPEARDLVRQIQDMRPAFQGLRDAAAAGLFPGLSTALDDLDRVLPRVEGILSAVGDAAGDVSAEFAAGIAGPRGREFLAFVEAEMPGALVELGRTAGNVAAGVAELWMAFAPLNRDVSGWLLNASRSFDEWAQGLSQTRGFQEFVAYVRENGPRVADAMGAIGNAVLQIVQAAAPLGGPTLAALEAVADVIAAIAGSDAGPALATMAAGLVLISRSVKAIQGIKASTLFTSFTTGADGASRSMTKLGRASAIASGGLVALAGVSVGLGALDRALAETLPGVEELTGRLIDLQGGRVGSLGAEFDSIGDSIGRLTSENNLQHAGDELIKLVTLGGLSGTRSHRGAQREIEALDAALTNLVSQGGADKAQAAFQELARSQGLTANETRTLLSLLPGYRDALAGAENQAKLTGEAGAEAGREAAAGLRRATSAAQTFRNAIAAANRALEGRASVRDYEQALDDLNKSIRQNGRTLDITTQKGRDNQAALDAVAASAVRVAQGMSRTNGIAFLRDARPGMVDAIRKLGLTRAEAGALADRLLGLDKIKANPSVELVGVAGLEADIARINSSLDYASRDRRTQITIAYARVGLSTVGGIQERAGGGTVMGPRFPYGDKVLLFAAPGEEVITNRHGEADRFRADRAAGRIPAYADGGMVAAMNRAPRLSSHTSTRVVERVVERVRTVVIDAGDLGEHVYDVVDDAVGSYRALDDRRRGTVYSGVGSD